MKTSVLVVDDQPLIRTAVVGLLESDPDIEVIGEAENGLEAVRSLEQSAPDVILMDIRMPQMDGIQATTTICSDTRFDSVRVLMLTTFEEDEYVFAALRAGASGFLGKGAEPDEIVRGVKSVHLGNSLLSPAATKTLIERYLQEPADRVPPTGRATRLVDLGSLTSRERDVLYLVGKGRSNDEIAGELYISPLTAKTHINRIMSKLHARDRAQLVICAYESGLLDADRKDVLHDDNA
ncbi:MAG: response regulator [Leucobacter sp.]